MSDLERESEAPLREARVGELGYAPMDRVHSDFEELLRRSGLSQPRESVENLAAIDGHLREHFEAEDGWMRETDFPSRDCHVDEHAAVLRSSGEVLALARRGNLEPAPRFVDRLRRWFPLHANYMDSALAAWMCKRIHGGKPVVIHRTKAESPPVHPPQGRFAPLQSL